MRALKVVAGFLGEGCVWSAEFVGYRMFQILLGGIYTSIYIEIHQTALEICVCYLFLFLFAAPGAFSSGGVWPLIAGFSCGSEHSLGSPGSVAVVHRAHRQLRLLGSRRHGLQ